MIDAGLLTGLLAAAVRKGLMAGDQTRLERRIAKLAFDLFPLAPTFSQAEPPKSQPHDSAVTPRSLGEAYWRIGLVDQRRKTPAAGSTAGGEGLENKKLAGSFYTPDWVIDEVLALFLPKIVQDNRLAGTVCDPALGCGFFPLRLVDVLLRDFPSEQVMAWAADNLHGMDIDPGAVFMARALLWLRLSEPGRDFQQKTGRFVHGDALLGPGFADSPARQLFYSADTGAAAISWRETFPACAEKGGFSVVFGNPPYEVLTNFRKYPERKVLAEALRLSGYYRDGIAGQINLYRCFIERGLGLLQPGGRLAMVVPLSLARDGGAAGLRRRLLFSEAGCEWKLYGEHEALFHGVTQSICIFAATRGEGKAKKINVKTAGREYRIQFADLGESLALPVFSSGGEEVWHWLRKNCPGRVGDVAEMRVGEVDQTVYRECMRNEPTNCLLARGEHLRSFVLDVCPNGGAEKWRYLDLPLFLAMKGKGAQACRDRANRTRVVQLGIRNIHSRPRLVAALAGPGVYLGNSLNVYAPKPGISLYFVAGVLNSRLLDWLFSLESGNNNINLYEMAALPFPWPCPHAVQADIETAYRECEGLAAAGRDTTTAAARLDAAVLAGYGLYEKGWGGKLPEILANY